MKTAVIIPAYNERDRIEAVISAVASAEKVDEIVVVSDGSTDGTYELVAADNRIKAVNLEKNLGKAGAMRVGAGSTDADIVLFLDADIAGLDGARVDSLLEPMLDGTSDMVVGVFKGGRKSTDLAQIIAPYISGQRAMNREEFLKIPELDEVRSGVETAITRYARLHKMRVAWIPLYGCTHCMKEEKLGLWKGFTARMKMYYDICKIILDGCNFKR